MGHRGRGGLSSRGHVPRLWWPKSSRRHGQGRRPKPQPQPWLVGTRFLPCPHLVLWELVPSNVSACVQIPLARTPVRRNRGPQTASLCPEHSCEPLSLSSTRAEVGGPRAPTWQFLRPIIQPAHKVMFFFFFFKFNCLFKVSYLFKSYYVCSKFSKSSFPFCYEFSLRFALVSGRNSCS